MATFACKELFGGKLDRFRCALQHPARGKIDRKYTPCISGLDHRIPPRDIETEPVEKIRDIQVICTDLGIIPGQNRH